jgi:hypothetical protein
MWFLYLFVLNHLRAKKKLSIDVLSDDASLFVCFIKLSISNDACRFKAPQLSKDWKLAGAILMFLEHEKIVPLTTFLSHNRLLWDKKETLKMQDAANTIIQYAHFFPWNTMLDSILPNASITHSLGHGCRPTTGTAKLHGRPTWFFNASNKLSPPTICRHGESIKLSPPSMCKWHNLTFWNTFFYK